MKKIWIKVLSVAIAANAYAIDFQDGYEKLYSSLEFNKVSLDIARYLEPQESYVDDKGNTFLRYSKHVEGIKLYGEDKLVIIPQKVRSGQGINASQTLAEYDIDFMRALEGKDLNYTLEQSEAFIIAVKDLRQNKALLHETLPSHLAKSAEVVLFRTDESFRLVWHLVLPGIYDGLKTSFEYFIDARNGEIVDSIRVLYDLTGQGYDLTEGKLHEFPVEEQNGKKILKDTGRKLNVYNGKQGTFSVDADGLWEDEGETRKQNQKAEVELYLNMARTVDYFKENHGFIWKNGASTVNATAHVRENFNNAYYSSWSGGFFFGDGTGDEKGFDYLTKGLDVAAHEFTHGVIDSLCPLTYSGESGALNEHIADFFGAMVDADEWQMGDNIAVGNNPALRNMKDPVRGRGDLITEGMTYNEWTKMHKDNGIRWKIYPDRVSKKIIANGSGQDNGGVHINSSIFNKFAYLATTGDEIEGEGLGYDLMAGIYMRLLKDKYLSRRASFQQFRNKFMAAAEIHLESDANREAHLQTLVNAFARIDL